MVFSNLAGGTRSDDPDSNPIQFIVAAPHDLLSLGKFLNSTLVKRELYQKLPSLSIAWIGTDGGGGGYDLDSKFDYGITIPNRLIHPDPESLIGLSPTIRESLTSIFP